MHLKRSWLISGTAVAGLVLAFNNCDGFSALKLNPETGASQSLTDVQVDSQTSAEFWDQARDRGVRTMSSGTALEPGADTCEIVGDFPIRTHFRNGVGPSPGGVDVPELFNKNIEQEVARGQALVRVYSNGYTPRHANYLEDNHDSQVFSDDTIKSALRHLCAADVELFAFDAHPQWLFAQPPARNGDGHVHGASTSLRGGLSRCDWCVVVWWWSDRFLHDIK